MMYAWTIPTRRIVPAIGVPFASRSRDQWSLRLMPISWFPLVKVRWKVNYNCEEHFSQVHCWSYYKKINQGGNIGMCRVTKRNLMFIFVIHDAYKLESTKSPPIFRRTHHAVWFLYVVVIDWRYLGTCLVICVLHVSNNWSTTDYLLLVKIYTLMNNQFGLWFLVTILTLEQRTAINFITEILNQVKQSIITDTITDYSTAITRHHLVSLQIYI